jgi:hypothetical protein
LAFTAVGTIKVQGRYVKGESAGAYGRDEVEAVERRAWVRCEACEYYFDGTHFWITENGSRWAAKPEVAPERGWQHRDACTCPLCRARETTRWLRIEALTCGGL